MQWWQTNQAEYPCMALLHATTFQFQHQRWTWNVLLVMEEIYWEYDAGECLSKSLYSVEITWKASRGKSGETTTSRSIEEVGRFKGDVIECLNRESENQFSSKYALKYFFFLKYKNQPIY